MDKVSVKKVRSDLLITQTKLAELAHVSRMTVSRCEKGEVIQMDVANNILDALNKARKARGLTELLPTDIDWKIRNVD